MGRTNRRVSLVLPLLLVFCILSGVVFSVSRKISREMSASAIQNLSESLNLIKCTIEAVLRNQAEFQVLMARELARAEDLEDYILAYEKNDTMVRVSVIPAGASQGRSSTGEAFTEEAFTEEGLDFSGGRTVGGLPVSQSYLNYMGTWAYTMKCPVVRDGEEIASLYVEYIYDALDRALPEGFYDNQAVLYIMDAGSTRFVLKPKGMGMRSAGHLNLADFYRANNITDPDLHRQVAASLGEGKNILFYHDIRDVNSLSYLWPVNGGSICLVGYVALEAIQQEGRTVNQNILLVVGVMLLAFVLSYALYFFYQRQQNLLRKEQEEERERHNRQLREALQAAQIANQSKTVFLSNMSHDIRTPMNAVLGFTALLALDAENPAKVREYTRKITASGQHLLSLINDILDVSKIESGKVVLACERFSLSGVVASVDAIIQPMAAARCQQFLVEVSGVRHEYLLGDETRLNQILINLLSNAVKYTQEGGTIHFRILGQKQRSSQYERLRIEVEDNGAGMTPEYLKTIFDAFTRAENSTTNKVQGTGLGMAITKNLVELMGGTIEVTSQLGEGSLFRVDLECRVPEDQGEERFWAERGIRRMLVLRTPEAEKDADAGDGGMLLLMKDAGVETAAASTLEEALALLQEQGGASCQLALVDWDTPDPIRSVRLLREALPEDTPILVLASLGDQGPEEALRTPCTGLVTKPFFVSSLRASLLALSRETPADPEEETDRILEGMRFLVAEDNAINAEILAELLGVEGAACEIVENGQLVLERFQTARPGEFNAILMDVQMPVMNGYEATRAIRALPRERIPILAMTANAFAEDEKAALDAGMDAHVPKPLDIGYLKHVIYRLTAGKEQA